MSLLIQHGYGKSDKIDIALRDGFASGLILGAKDHKFDQVSEYLADIKLAHPDALILLDPQLHAMTIQDAKLRYLVDYPHFRNISDLSYPSLVNSKKVRELAGDCVSSQDLIALSGVVTPTISLDRLDNKWAGVAYALATETIASAEEKCPDKPVFVSFVISEQTLQGVDELNDFLDIVSQFECDGFYIVINRYGKDYQQDSAPETLSKQMYIAHVLSEINGFQVHFGYCDLISPLILAAGGTTCASGWYQSLRQFSMGRFEPSSGGRRPRPRYTSKALLTSIFLNPELDQIANVNMLGSVLTGSNYDAMLNITTPSSASNWKDQTSSLHHLQTLGMIHDEITSQSDQDAKLNRIEQLIDQGISIRDQLKNGGVPITMTHLDSWSQALAEFRTLI